MAKQSMLLDPPVSREVKSFAGLLSQIPTGWQLCDGTNSTPDLRNKFIRMVAAGENPGLTGGSNFITIPNHTNVSVPGTATSAVKVGTSASNAAAQTHTHTIPTISHTQVSNEPEYYKLAYITRPEWWP
jgi:hypothetical protein